MKHLDHNNNENKYRIEPGNVLVVLSDREKCCFHSMYCVLENGTEPLGYQADKHLGMTTDSFVIVSDGYEVNIGYFPRYDRLEFYRIKTIGLPVYIENAGEQEILCEYMEKSMTLAPGERKCLIAVDPASGKEA